MAEIYRLYLVDDKGRVREDRSSETPDLPDVLDELLGLAYSKYSKDHGFIPQRWKLEVHREY